VSISSTFYTCVYYTKVLFCQNITREKLRKALLYEKCLRKMLMKLIPGYYSFHDDLRYTIEQWFLTFKFPWTPKSLQKVPRTPKVPIGTTCEPLNHCKRDVHVWVKYFTFLIFADTRLSTYAIEIVN